jgi:hypothetical protein
MYSSRQMSARAWYTTVSSFLSDLQLWPVVCLMYNCRQLSTWYKTVGSCLPGVQLLAVVCLMQNCRQLSTEPFDLPGCLLYVCYTALLSVFAWAVYMSYAFSVYFFLHPVDIRNVLLRTSLGQIHLESAIWVWRWRWRAQVCIKIYITLYTPHPTPIFRIWDWWGGGGGGRKINSPAN